MKTRKWLAAAFGALARRNMRTIIASAITAALLTMMGSPQALASVAHNRHPFITLFCGFLRDDDGAGLAMSAFPSLPPQSGDFASMESLGAWRVCYETDDDALYLESDSGKCFANIPSTTEIDFRDCNDDKDQSFEEVDNNGVLTFRNVATGGLLCGMSATVDSTLGDAPFDCPGQASFQEWEFMGSP